MSGAWDRPSLPELSPEAARGWSVLAARLPMQFASPAGAAVLHWAPMEPTPAGWRTVDATIDGHAARLSLRPDLVPGGAAHWDVMADGPLPDALRAVLLETVLDGVSASFRAWSNAALHWSPASPETHLPHALVVRCKGVAAASIHLDDAALAWLAQRVGTAPPRCSDLARLPVTCDLLLDGCSVPARELRGVGAGDVILLDRPVLDAEGALAAVLRAGTGAGFPGWRARLHGGRLTLLEPVDALMDNAEPPPLSGFADLMLPVEFIAGRLDLPLSRLQELAPGQVLDLGRDAAAAISVRVNGQVVATGELVQLGERTGIRLTSVHMARA